MGSRLTIGAAALALALPSGAAAAGTSIDAHGSARQVYATGLDAGARMSLVNGTGRSVATKRANKLGGLLFRNVKPGNGYRLRAAKGGSKSDAFTVFSTKSAPPSEDGFDQEIQDNGYQYLTTRDGTELAIYVHPPEDVSNVLPTGYVPHVPAGPTPTLIEYAGYGYADPAGPQSGISILANLMGFTVVDVNMRGTGCSGGSFDFFEPLQGLDGYDVIETISRQPWVKFGQVGMMGISYGGISQLFTAETDPPSLAAISPLSLIDAVQTTLYPGGILNTGFAFNWAKERAYEARPAGPKGGQEWAYKRVQEGDKTCEANQAMHPEAAKLIKKVRANHTYKPKVADPLSPITFVDKIKVPTFVACQWTDEQTGGHCPTLASRFTGTDKKWFTFTNGTHVDSLAPETFNRWYDFLMLYVARQAPSSNQAGIRAAAPLIYDAAMGIDGQMLPPDPIQEEPTYEGALAAFEALDPIRILFDNGAGGDPGKPNPGFEQSFPEFPIPDANARSWYLAGGGTLQDDPSDSAGADAFTWNARSTALTDFHGDTAAGENGLWTATPAYEWQQKPEGNAVSYLSGQLAENTTVIGAGAVHAWVRSSKPTVDLIATVTEVRPDGKETFVQSGWVRGKMRKLDKKQSTLLEPVLSLRARDMKPMPHRRFVKVVIPLYYQGHAYRVDSHIRLTISDPNGDQPIWAFEETRPKGKKHANVAIAYSKTRPSRLILPVVPGVDVPTALPPCPGLRGEPCRDYEVHENRSATR